MAAPKAIVRAKLQRDQSRRETVILNELERRLINEYQKGLPLSPRPYAEMAEHLGCSEEQVMQMLKRLQNLGAISRVGPVFKPKRIGASTLAAMAVPPQRLESVAALISAYPEVNHNYEREHHFNLWFVVTAPDPQRLQQVLDEMSRRTGLEVLDLPLEQQFHIDLGFPLWC